MPARGKLKDARGNYTLTQYDAKGNPLQQIKLKSGLGATVDPATYAPAAADIAAWSIAGFDAYGNLVKRTQVRDIAAQVATPGSTSGPSFQYSYDAQNLNVIGMTRYGDKNGDRESALSKKSFSKVS